MTLPVIMMGIIPAGLAVLGGLIVLRRNSSETANQRFLLYWLVLGYALFLLEFILDQLSPTDNQLGQQAAALFMPTGIVVLALIIISFKFLPDISGKTKFLAILLALGILIFIVGAWTQPNGSAQIVCQAGLLLAITWMLGTRFDVIAILMGLVSLVSMVIYNSGRTPMVFALSGEWVTALTRFFVNVLPAFTIVLAASLIQVSLKQIVEIKPSLPPDKRVWRQVLIASRFLLAAVLIGNMAYTIYWAEIWDQTSDGILAVWLAMQTSLVAIAAGILMGFASTGWRRKAGFGFCILVPFLMFGAFAQKWGIYKDITSQRAAELQTALVRFQARNARYPADLQELVPRDLLWIQEPVILKGESWCYHGEKDAYQLGTVFREYFSSPLSYRVYASAGVPTGGASACETRLDELKARYDSPPIVGGMENYR
jgi:hypothetical protein